jgi:uncharacterized protein with PIN domain
LKEATRSNKFATDGTLGKLNKWLRILGFDTCEYSAGADGPVPAPVEDRLLLTRMRKRYEWQRDQRCLSIRSNDPMEQLREVVRALDLSQNDIAPFSRCILCNTAIEPVAKGSIRNAVPEYVWSTRDRFCQCLGCQKVYWAGSHTARSLERVKDLFERRTADGGCSGSET